MTTINVLLLLLTVSAFGCARHVEIKPLDTCPSPDGYSCPLDGSPCPFCNDEQQ